MSAVEAAAVVAKAAPEFTPRVGLILGSGLGGIADKIESPIAIPYGQLPGFVESTVAGHAGRLVLGTLAGVKVACLQGRVHLYEGQPAAAIRNFVRTLKLIGCEIMIATNAAGALRREMGPGSLMMISDHINFLPMNPLVGPNEESFGPRFPAMNDAYDPKLRQGLRRAAGRAGIKLHEGIYLGCLGPNLETPAEIRAFTVLGADAVGMSTVPEVIVARHCGLRVAAVSVITNLAAGLADEVHSHEQTLLHSARAVGEVTTLLTAFLERLDDGD